MRRRVVASSVTAAIARAHGSFFDVLQYSWSPLDRRADSLLATKFHITHRTLMRAYEPLRVWLRASPAISRRLSLATDLDLSRAPTLSAVLLGAALAHNPGGVVLVGTRRMSRVRENLEAMKDANLVAAGRAFLHALELESDLPLPT